LKRFSRNPLTEGKGGGKYRQARYLPESDKLRKKRGVRPSISREMRQIKQLAITIALVLSIMPLSVRAQSRSKKLTIGKLEDVFSTAFAIDTLETLDAKYPNRAKMRVEIGYTSIEPDIKVFDTFGALGRWLRSMERETDGGPSKGGSTMKLPLRVTMPLVGCRQGACTYDFDGGILHNHLYLKKISYGYRKGRPFIKSIFLING
jgi:hypothetical protein